MSHLCGLGVLWLHLVPQSEFITETEMGCLEASYKPPSTAAGSASASLPDWKERWASVYLLKVYFVHRE